MKHYRFTESQDAKGNPIGTLEKQVTEGGQTSWQDDLKGYIPYDKEAEKDKEHDIAIADINSKIPEEASEENKLATDEDVATNSATFRGTYNLVSDLSLTTSATRDQVAAALGTAISECDNNDFCYVEVPTADATPTEIARTDRYKFNGTAWAFEFSLPGFTASEWAAIESGITGQLVQKLIDLATVATTGSYDDLSNKPTIPAAQIQSDWSQSDSEEKDYIKNKPTIPVIPTNVSAFINDAGYLTQHQDISGKADKTYVDTSIEEESAFQKNFATIVALAADPNAGVTTVTDNPEWKIVYTDANDAILLGKRQDNTWYVATDLDTILDAIISGYNAS